MMPARFTVTYDIVTPESAEYGEAAAAGFADVGGWRYSEPVLLTLRDALKVCGCMPCESGGCGSRSFYCYPETLYSGEYAGAEETRAIHAPTNTTPASLRRLARLFGVRQ